MASIHFHTQAIQNSSERRTRFPSPLAGEGDRAEAKPSEVGRGVIFIQEFSNQTPLPARARYRSARSTLSRKGREGKRVCRASYHLTPTATCPKSLRRPPPL